MITKHSRQCRQHAGRGLVAAQSRPCLGPVSFFRTCVAAQRNPLQPLLLQARAAHHAVPPPQGLSQPCPARRTAAAAAAYDGAVKWGQHRPGQVRLVAGSGEWAVTPAAIQRLLSPLPDLCAAPWSLTCCPAHRAPAARSA